MTKGEHSKIILPAVRACGVEEVLLHKALGLLTGSAFDFRCFRLNAFLGFNDKVNLDEGAIWPTTFALKEFTAAEESMIIELVKRAVS